MGLRTAPVEPVRFEAALLARDGGHPEIREALSSGDPDLRRSALIAMGRIANAGTSEVLVPFLKDPDPGVAAAAAFALGQLPPGEAEPQLALALRVGWTPAASLAAMSRVASLSSVPGVAHYLESDAVQTRAAAALALGVIGKRLPELDIAPFAVHLASMLKAADLRERFAASYALMRSPGPDAAGLLPSMLADGEAEVRVNAVRGLGMSAVGPSTLDPVLADPDWRVRVELARALGRYGDSDEATMDAALKRLATVVQRALVSASTGAVASGHATHVMLATIEAVGAFKAAGSVLLTSLLNKADWPLMRSDVARVQCAAARQLSEIDGKTRRIRLCGNTSLPAWRRPAAEAEVGARLGRMDILGANLKHSDERVRASSANLLGQLQGPAAGKLAVLRLRDDDPHVVAGAAVSVTQAGFAPEMVPGLVDGLGLALDRMAELSDPNFAVAVVDAIGRLGEAGRRLRPKVEAVLSDPRPSLRARGRLAFTALGGQPGSIAPTGIERQVGLDGAAELSWVLETARGDIELLLDASLAPFTVRTFTHLVRDGFYTGLRFHRVVSDFVVQGGCPRGDGWGGPGFAILEERSVQPFVRGTIGIATNGRDTGGSQFFVMHGYQPHLDGQYTAIGRVVGGMDVVDALHQDDRIRRIRVRRDSGGGSSYDSQGASATNQ